jgi:regulator of replication initiation timing
MDYNELYEKYQKLLEENQNLKAENEEYRRRLGIVVPVSRLDCDDNTASESDNQVSKPALDNNSSPEDKIKLFMSLFKGRDDVYAKRWQNKKGSPGYSFVCLNEWAAGLCHKPKIKCSECNNRNYAALNPDVIDRHLRGGDVFGIYPMLTDETCYFLAIDFDGEGWEKDISVIRDICNEKKIPFDTLFLAMPVAWKGTVQQYAGRLHRLYQNKSEVQIYDYVDVHVGVLERMYQKRLKGYASIGYAAKGDSKPFESINAIFNNNNFLTVFNNDILSAKNEIIIVSPYIGKRRLAQMLNILMTAINNGARVTVITRPETDYKEKDRISVQEMTASLKNSEISVVLKANIHQKFAVIDQRIVWYGSVNLLSFGSSEESIMRLESLNIANELTGAI